MNYKSFWNNTVFSDSCITARKEIRDSLQGLNIYDVYRKCPKSKIINENLNKKEISQQKIMLKTLKKISHSQKNNKLLKEYEFISDELNGLNEL